MDNGEDYLSVMKENLTALKKQQIQPGKRFSQKPLKNRKTVANGYFKDSEVAERTLTDYAGNWQSVYPLLKDGTLDQVFDYKAKLKKIKHQPNTKPTMMPAIKPMSTTSTSLIPPLNFWSMANHKNSPIKQPVIKF